MRLLLRPASPRLAAGAAVALALLVSAPLVAPAADAAQSVFGGGATSTAGTAQSAAGSEKAATGTAQSAAGSEKAATGTAQSAAGSAAANSAAAAKVKTAPAPKVKVTTAGKAATPSTATATTATTAEETGSGVNSSLVIALVVAVVLLGGIAFVIVRNARSVAPVVEAFVTGGTRNPEGKLRKRRAQAKAARQQRKRHRKK